MDDIGVGVFDGKDPMYDDEEGVVREDDEELEADEEFPEDDFSEDEYM